MVLNPAATIWSSMSCQLRAQSPWGEKVPVSKPNHVIPVNRTSWPLASTTLPPAVWKKPVAEPGTGRSTGGAGDAGSAGLVAGACPGVGPPEGRQLGDAG